MTKLEICCLSKDTITNALLDVDVSDFTFETVLFAVVRKSNTPLKRNYSETPIAKKTKECRLLCYINRRLLDGDALLFSNGNLKELLALTNVKEVRVSLQRSTESERKLVSGTIYRRNYRLVLFIELGIHIDGSKA
jgi:hypothetical protein